MPNEQTNQEAASHAIGCLGVEVERMIHARGEDERRGQMTSTLPPRARFEDRVVHVAAA